MLEMCPPCLIESLVQQDPKYEGCPLNRVFSRKFLGLYLDDTLSWDTHINTLVGRLASTIGVLRRLCIVCLMMQRKGLCILV